jgi:hypothetical protein
MPKWIGNRFGNAVPVNPGGEGPSAVYSMFDQYYMRQEGGWVTPVSMSGGTAFGPVTIDGAERMVCRFRSPGTFTLTDGNAPSARILVVGGGGAGGSFNPGAYGGGGGGAGGVRYIPSISLTAGTYPISVGDGGTGGNPWGSPKDGGTPAQPKGGGTSSIFNPGDGNSVPAITATGGGAGGISGGIGGSGGSGGGASYPGPHNASGDAGGLEPRANPTSEGNPSETLKSGTGSRYHCGGGGGAGASSPTPWQNGASGITLSGVGSPSDPWLPPAGNVFGGGGGGSSYKETDGNGSGGPGGGGDAPGGDGTEYTGGGGGGIGSPNGVGGDGGFGVVYVIIPKAEVGEANPGPGS